MNRFRRNRLVLLKSGQWHFHQDNTLVHNSILVTDYLTKMGITIKEMEEAMTKVIDTLAQEDFHGALKVPIIVPIRKKSGNLFNDHRISTFVGYLIPKPSF